MAYTLPRRDRFPVVLHHGERIVEMVEKRPPPGITVRLAEPGIVVFEAAPADEEQVASRALDARPHLEPEKSLARGNKRQRLDKGSLESCRLARPELENRVLEYHD